jgi:GntR family transcriptional regulator
MRKATKHSSPRMRQRDVTPIRHYKKSEPINAQIFSTLRQRILKKEYGDPGSLPPELALASEFRVSRYTIRAALQKLVIDGLIERRRGSGTTIVQRDPQQGTWAVGSLDQVLGAVAPGDVLSLGPVPASDFPKVARLFRLSDGEPLFQVTRLVLSPRGPLSYSTVFTRVELASRVPRKQLSSKFLLTLLEEHCGLRAARARQVASAVIAPPAAQQALGLKQNDPALLLQRTFLTRSGEPIEHVEMYCRSDTYAQIVDYYREEEMRSAVCDSGHPKARSSATG